LNLGRYTNQDVELRLRRRHCTDGEGEADPSLAHRLGGGEGFLQGKWKEIDVAIRE
jgi:hypothetical protein